MVCVLGSRSTVLPDAWGDVCGSICLTVWVTHDPSTGVRATTSLRGERAHQRCLFSPLSPVFSRALFSTTLPTLVENGWAEPFPRFQPPDWFISVLCSIMEMCNLACHLKGDGEGGKRGTGGENPEGEGGLQPGCPPFPGLSPQDIGKPVLRKRRIQSIKDHTQAKRKPRRRHAPAGFIMWLPADCRTCPGTDAPLW